MPVVEVTDATNTFHAGLVTNVTAQRITRISRIDNQSFSTNNLDSLLNQACLRINRVYLKKLAH